MSRFYRKSGQTEAISVVMIMGIIIALVFVAYVWGIPLIEKRETMAEFESAKAFALNVHDKIVEIANSHTGSYRFDLNGKNVKLIPLGKTGADFPENTLAIQFFVKQPLIAFEGAEDPALEGYIYLGAPSYSDTVRDVGTYGESSPGLISMKQERLGSTYTETIKMTFRPLITSGQPERAYKIALKNTDSANPTAVKEGHSQILISFKGIDVGKDITYGTPPNQKTVKGTVTNIEVEVV